jgi:UDP-N-acetyl-D-glucosamine/UDP-N-acetyl-D-galactosamine dehydrogenase
MASDRNKIGIVGLGYVGLPLAVEFGKSRAVVGFDLDKNRIAELKIGQDSTCEVSEAELQEATYLELSSSEATLSDCNIFIVTVPTPIDEANRPNLGPLIAASETIGKYLKDGDIVVYESTVYPGCTEEICVPTLEQASNLVFNKDFFCGYSPERINPGDKENRLPQIVKITSGSTPEVAEVVDDLYASIIIAGTYRATSIRVAEAAKVIENTQRDLNIALVNELSVIFDELRIDTIEVLQAAGSKWNFLPFRPGIVGGHCIGVDPYYLTHKAEMVGYTPQVILAGRRINDEMAKIGSRKFIQKMVTNNINIVGSTVGILGITFKENCPDIRNSKVMDVINELRKWNIDVIVIDPWANKGEVQESFGIELRTHISTGQVDSLLVAVGHQEFRTIEIDQLRNLCRGDNPVLGDFKAIYDRHEAEEVGFSVYRF